MCKTNIVLGRADEAVRDAELALQAMQAVAGRTHPIMQSFWEALAKIKEAVSFPSSPLFCLVAWGVAAKFCLLRMAAGVYK